MIWDISKYLFLLFMSSVFFAIASLGHSIPAYSAHHTACRVVLARPGQNNTEIRKRINDIKREIAKVEKEKFELRWKYFEWESTREADLTKLEIARLQRRYFKLVGREERLQNLLGDLNEKLLNDE